MSFVLSILSSLMMIKDHRANQSTVTYLGFGKEREPNGGLGAEPPAGSRAEPLVGGQGGEAP